LFYANAQAVRNAIEAAVHHPDPATRIVIVDLDANDEIDITSAVSLNKLAESLERNHVQLALAHVHRPALTIARKAGLLTKVANDHLFANIPMALPWARPSVDTPDRHAGRR
jgi:MFS superfamily sulfate permease-like transporter